MASLGAFNAWVNSASSVHFCRAKANQLFTSASRRVSSLKSIGLSNKEQELPSQLSEQWSTNLAYTRLQATYDSDFVSGGSTAVDKGNYLPGVPQTTLFAELNWKPRDWVSTAIEGLYRSKVYVEDTNSQHAAPAYSVFNWRARFEQKVEHWTFHQSLRLDNLLDRQYVGSVIVGDGNNRYYEAAPGRSWYAGAGAEYQF